MALFMVNFQDKVEKKFSKVCLVGTLNLCLKEPEKMQKTRNQSNHPRQKKRPKTGKNRTPLWGRFHGGTFESAVGRIRKLVLVT